MYSSELQLKVFKEVVDAGSITQAAKRLYISQSSVSVQIKKLESQFATQLIMRTNHGIELTQAGRILYDATNTVLETLDRAKYNIDELKKHEHNFITLGTTFGIGEYFLPHLMDVTDANGDVVKFNTTMANVDVITQLLIEDRVKIGLIEAPVLKEHLPYLEFEDFWDDELFIVTPYNHHWGNRSCVTFDELCKEKIIITNRKSGLRRCVEEKMAEGGYDFTHVSAYIEVNSLTSIKQAVLSGLGVTIASAAWVNYECTAGLMRMYRLDGVSFKRPLRVALKKDVVLSDEEMWFLNVLRNHKIMESLLPKSEFIPTLCD